MKKILFPAIIAVVPSLAIAQSTVDAYSLSQTDLRGTARFMCRVGKFKVHRGNISPQKLTFKQK